MLKYEIMQKFNLTEGFCRRLIKENKIFKTENGYDYDKKYFSTFSLQEYVKVCDEQRAINQSKSQINRFSKIEERDKISKTLNSPEVKRKLIISQNSEKTRAKRVQSLLDYYSKPESIEKKRKEAKEVQNRLEVKLKQSIVQKEVQNRPDIQKRRKESIQKAWTKEKREEFSKLIKSKEVQQKTYETRKRNNSFNSSSTADDCEKWLRLLGLTIETEKPYPNESNLHCDLYIKELDLWVEMHYSHYHNHRPFDSLNEEHVNEAKELLSKSGQYQNIHYQWTNLDVRKKQNAERNKLNWVAFYSPKDFDNFFYNLGYGDIN